MVSWAQDLVRLILEGKEAIVCALQNNEMEIYL